MKASRRTLGNYNNANKKHNDVGIINLSFAINTLQRVKHLGIKWKHFEEIHLSYLQIKTIIQISRIF